MHVCTDLDKQGKNNYLEIVLRCGLNADTGETQLALTKPFTNDLWGLRSTRAPILNKPFGNRQKVSCVVHLTKTEMYFF